MPPSTDVRNRSKASTLGCVISLVKEVRFRKIRRFAIKMRNKNLKLFFSLIYLFYVASVLFQYGFPRKISEFTAMFIVPAMSVAFLYLFYGSINNARNRK